MTRKCHVRFGGEGEETRLPNKAGGCALPLPYHEYREKWITQEWNWYQSVRGGELEHESVAKQAAKQQIQARYQEMQGYASRDTQTRRGQLFEMIADLTDDDGALAEMEDLPGWVLDDEKDEDDLR